MQRQRTVPVLGYPYEYLKMYCSQVSWRPTGCENVHTTLDERYAEENPGVRLPTRVGWDLNDCEENSLLDHLEKNYGLRRDVPTMFISEAVMFYVNPRAIASLYADIFAYGENVSLPTPPPLTPHP